MSAPSLRFLVFQNTGIRFAAQAVSMLVTLAGALVLSRYFGVEKFGGLNYVITFYYFFLVVQDLGVDVIVVRECARKPEQSAKIIGTMRIFKFSLSLFLAALSWALITLTAFPAELKPALYIYALILPLVALQHSSVIFQLKLDAKHPSLIAIMKSAANFIFLIFLVMAGFGMTGYVLALVLSELAVLAAVIYFSRRFIRVENTFDRALCAKILKSSFAIAAAGIFVALTNRVDFLMLERMSGLRELGFYSAIYKVTNLLESLPLAIMTTLYPVMSRYAEERDGERLKKLYRKSLVLFTVMGLPMGAAVTVLAGPIVQLLFGAEFGEAAAGLRVLIWAVVFLYTAISAGNLLISLGKEKINLAVNIFAAFLNIALNFFWIPKYGFVGASYATVCAYFFIMTLSLAAAHTVLRKRNGAQGALNHENG